MTAATEPSAPPNESPAAPAGGRPLASYLVLLGFAIALPSLLFSAYLLYRFEETERAGAARVAEDRAESIRDAVEREIAAMSTTLKVLSTSELLRQGNFAALHDRIELALAGTGTFVILADPNYRQMLNTRVPYGTALGEVTDRASVDEALRTGKLHVSDLFYGSVAKQFVINIALPVAAQAGEHYVLIMTRDAETFSSVLSELNLDPGWSGTLIDGEPAR